MNPFTALPAKWRAGIYYATFVLTVLYGGTRLGFDTVHVALPVWLVVAGKVGPFLVGAFSITAASNTVVRARRVLDDREPAAVTPAAVAAEVVRQLQSTPHVPAPRLRDAGGRFRSPADRS